jgi:DNA/RNA-binding protein KIN17
MGKVKYFCQMCEKQCRDANGFKCHLATEGHRNQMREFLENPQKYIEEFSDAFENQFMSELGEKLEWLFANEVYSAVLRDPSNVRLNATKWSSLTDFLSYLEEGGYIAKKPDPNKPSTFMIKRLDPELEERLEREKLEGLRRKQREIEREDREFEKRIKLAEFTLGDETKSRFEEATKVTRSSPNEKISLSLKPRGIMSSAFSAKESDDDDEEERRDFSLLVDCIVKIIAPGIHEGVKGRVMPGSTDSDLSLTILKSHQVVSSLKRNEVETVIPNIQKKVKVINPSNVVAGSVGILLSVDSESGTGKVFFGHLNESLEIPFDDFSKYAIE